MRPSLQVIPDNRGLSLAKIERDASKKTFDVITDSKIEKGASKI